MDAESSTGTDDQYIVTIPYMKTTMEMGKKSLRSKAKAANESKSSK